jgi:hypothetical protein
VSSSAAADASPSLVVGDVASSSGHGTPWPLLGGGLVVLALVGGTALRLRGRR